MKIAVTSTGPDLEAMMDPRFGRAAYLLVIDPDTLDFEAVNNSDNVNAFKGAGIQAACKVNEKGASVLLTGYCGPNAFKTLSAAEVSVCQNVTGSVREAVALFKDGKLTFSDTPNAEGQDI
jgi:predicted Fe-Mo cluster-binding NifX family protein